MAYSTRKAFFKWDFDREAELDCRCVKMKTYESAFDNRSWALSAEQKSQFYADLVKCNTAREPEKPEEEEDDSDDEPAPSTKRKSRASEAEVKEEPVPEKKKKRKSADRPVHTF